MTRSTKTMFLGLLIMIFGAIIGSSPAINGLLLANFYAHTPNGILPSSQDIYTQFLQLDYLAVAIIAVGFIVGIVGFFIKD